MRRDPRPFVVEVRRGPKKTPSAPAPSPFVDRTSDDDMMRRAEEALFGKPEPVRETTWGGEPVAPTGDQQPQRRILEAIAPGAEVVESPPESEPARRGRKPGSKNRPKEAKVEVEADPGGKRRRGRPRKHPEGEVRSVEITPELATAALEIMSRAVPPAPLPSSPVALNRPKLAPPTEAKRPRGRPRKHPLPSAVATVEEPPAPILSPGGMSATRIINRYGAEGGTQAGRRWMRRLRSYANPDHVSRRLTRP